MCIQLFGVVICIDNVILVSCVTALFALISYVKRKLQYRKWLRTPKEEMVDAEEVFERLENT